MTLHGILLTLGLRYLYQVLWEKNLWLRGLGFIGGSAAAGALWFKSREFIYGTWFKPEKEMGDWLEKLGPAAETIESIYFLENYFRRYVGYDFTAALEEELDHVSAGEADYKQVLRDFWRDFKAALDETGLKIPMATTNTFTHPVFKDGAFTHNDRDVRRFALRKIMRNLDLAAELGTPPLFLMTGSDDATAPPRDARALAQAARRGGSTAQVVIVPGQEHPWRGDAAVQADHEASVDGDAVRAQRQCGRLGEHVGRALRRAVGHLPRVRGLGAGDRGHVADPARPTGLEHGAGDALRHQERALGVGGHDLVPLPLGHLEEVDEGAHTRVVDEAVETSELGDGAADGPSERFLIGDIELEPECLAAATDYRVRRGSGCFEV